MPKMRLHIGFVAFFTMIYDYDHDFAQLESDLLALLRLTTCLRKAFKPNSLVKTVMVNGHGLQSNKTVT